MDANSIALVPTPGLPTPAGWYLTGEDALRLTIINSVAGVTATLRGRFLPVRQDPREPDARVGIFSHDLVPATNRTTSTRTEVLGEGWLLDWSVVVSGGSPSIGQTYATVAIVRGKTGSVLPLSVVGAGYVTATQPLGGPGGLMQGTLDGAGALRSITGTTPGAGAEISETVPTGARWELISFAAQLVTSVTVAPRFPALTFDDGANVYFRSYIGQTSQPASTTAALVWAEGMPLEANTVLISVGALPIGNRLGAGHRIRTSTANIQVGDQYSAVQYLVREWFEGA